MLQTGFAITVTVNEHVDEFPQASVATLVTVVVPSGKVLPDDGVETTVTEPAQLSVAVTVKLTALLHCPTVILAGHVITGGWVSLV
jgi:hypothetical protein